MTASSDDRAELVGEYPAAAMSVRDARDAVARLAARWGADPTIVEDIRLAVSEAATNAVMHAYANRVGGNFRVFAVADDDEMLVAIEDDGCGLTHPASTPGLGAGLRVMRQVSHAAVFAERARGGSTVQLTFKLRSH